MIERILSSKIKSGLDEKILEILPTVESVEFINSGSTVLNLVLSGKGADGGWARGRVINIVGDGSTGKCNRNAYVLSSNGMELIDDIGKHKDCGITKYNDTYSLTEGIKNKVTNFYKEKVKSTIKISTRHGFELEGTFDHPIIVWNKNCTFTFKKLSEIKIGDIAVILKGVNNYSDKKIKFDFDKETRGVKDIVIPDSMAEEIAVVLGYFVADGNFSKTSLSFSNTKKFFKDEMDKSLRIFGIGMTKDRKSVCGIRIVSFFKNIFGNPNKFTARNKYVPNCILQSGKDIQVSFLRSLIDCDSYCNETSLNYYTASKRLADQVHLMLLNMGILASHTIKKEAKIGSKIYKHDYHAINITGKNLILYSYVVGSKKYNFKELLKSKLPVYKSKSDFDSIPFLIERMVSDKNKIKEEIGWSKNGRIKKPYDSFPRIQIDERGKCSFEFLGKFVNSFEKYSEYFDISIYKRILEGNFHFDPITKVDKVNHKNGVFVYDVFIPKGHTFWANGFANHNTLLALETIASTLKKYVGRKSDKFSDVSKVKIRYNNVERVMDFDLEKIWKLKRENIEWTASGTIQEFGRDFGRTIDELKDGEMLLYFLDSLDGLSSEEEVQRFEKSQKKNESIDGSFNMEKQSYFGKFFRSEILPKMENKDITLFIISQVRANIGVTFGEKFRRSGGKALDFYTHQVVWLSEVQKLTKDIQGKKIVNGIRVKAKLKRSKVSKPYREVEFVILFDWGMDDVGSNVDYLFDLSGRKTGDIVWDGKKFKSRDYVIKYVEENDQEKELMNAVEEKWNKIEDEAFACKGRKPKY